MRWPDDFSPEMVERARALVRPQPPPRDVQGDPIWPKVAAETDWIMPKLAIALMYARDEFGREKYGVPLRLGDGRDHRADVVQEVLDCVVYAKAQAMKQQRDVNDKSASWSVVYAAAIDFLKKVVEAIEQEGA